MSKAPPVARALHILLFSYVGEGALVVLDEAWFGCNSA
jgi:hypothetical protein